MLNAWQQPEISQFWGSKQVLCFMAKHDRRYIMCILEPVQLSQCAHSLSNKSRRLILCDKCDTDMVFPLTRCFYMTRLSIMRSCHPVKTVHTFHSNLSELFSPHSITTCALIENNSSKNIQNLMLSKLAMCEPVLDNFVFMLEPWNQDSSKMYYFLADTPNSYTQHFETTPYLLPLHDIKPVCSTNEADILYYKMVILVEF